MTNEELEAIMQEIIEEVEILWKKISEMEEKKQ
jgi:hypothetical protein